MKEFLINQFWQIQHGGIVTLVRKFKLVIILVAATPLFIAAFPIVVFVRLIRPWLLIRFSKIISVSIGHFSANTELYLCERDFNINVPTQRYVDIFYVTNPISNQQLLKMWNRILIIWPRWFVAPIHHVNKIIPGGGVHEIPGTDGRDVYNLYDKTQPHLRFTDAENRQGEAGLASMGIPRGQQFVCLIVRDDAYHKKNFKSSNFDYHSYRNSNIENYVLASEMLADQGYFVVRMGAKVRKAIPSSHPKIIDYAVNGMRSDFMDIYLGAKCAFCISTGTGWDGIPEIFRRPIVYVNFAPVGYFLSFRESSITIFKHNVLQNDKKHLSLSEIFNRKAAFCLRTSEYEKRGIELIENTSQEIADAVTEMMMRLSNSWSGELNDDFLQQRAVKIFEEKISSHMNKEKLHGNLKSRIGIKFLRANHEWIR
jgi:putative glycosyltransferase (TIGR04372 family)